LKSEKRGKKRDTIQMQGLIYTCVSDDVNCVSKISDGAKMCYRGEICIKDVITGKIQKCSA